jgi:hypothetical protein
MVQRIKAVLPLSIAVAILAFIWVEASMNFTFHWVTNGDLGIGLALPASFHLVAPAAFISWGAFFAAGADRAALRSCAAASVVGSGAAFLLMLVGPHVADLPDFWGIALVLAVLALVVVGGSALGEWYYVPGMFGAFAAVVFWWMATGLDGWAANGGGVGNSVAALAKPETAGSGAFGGVLSTPMEWVFLSSLASLLCGSLLGILSVKLAATFSSISTASHPVEDMPVGR